MIGAANRLRAGGERPRARCGCPVRLGQRVLGGCGAGPWLFSCHGVAGCSVRQPNRWAGRHAAKSRSAAVAGGTRMADPNSPKALRCFPVPSPRLRRLSVSARGRDRRHITDSWRKVGVRGCGWRRVIDSRRDGVGNGRAIRSRWVRVERFGWLAVFGPVAVEVLIPQFKRRHRFILGCSADGLMNCSHRAMGG